MKVLVCGGRDYHDEAVVAFILGSLELTKQDCVIHGAARGADQLAAIWATRNGVPQEPYPAKWREHGRSAGPKRNLEMLLKGKPDLVVAFPGGKGTAHMMKIAKEANVTVMEVS